MPELAPSADVHVDPKFAPNAAWLLWHAQARRATHPAIQDGARRTTYGELGAGAQAVAGHLVALGVEPGSVTPFALINDRERRVTPILDAAMMAHEVLNYHPLVNTMTTSIRAADLLKFAAATGHSPLIRAVSAPVSG